MAREHGEWENAEPTMPFEILGVIEQPATIAAGPGIRDLRRLRRRYGGERWLKRKGVAVVRLEGGHVRRAELHRYEAHGVGRVQMKIKRFVD